MKGTIVPIKPEVVVKVIECGPLRIGEIGRAHV